MRSAEELENILQAFKKEWQDAANMLFDVAQARKVLEASDGESLTEAATRAVRHNLVRREAPPAYGFGAALELMLDGKAVRRRCWDRAWVCKFSAGNFPMFSKVLENMPPVQDFASGVRSQEVVLSDALVLRDESALIRIGWMPSVHDLFATDWVVAKIE